MKTTTFFDVKVFSYIFIRKNKALSCVFS